ncbi:MAG TPA: hypothetical protein VMZ53_12670 [Kofleriaceae bacterium]|nr:hypothetical protein [Kofleriaceae bacterium]
MARVYLFVTYRNDLEALQARKVALDAAVDSATRERDATAQILEEAKARTRLPVLPNLRIASPCTERWDAMSGDERVRHCGKCDKDVFDLSALTREQAESLIRERAGDLCARYYQRKDGTILLADCEVGARGVRRRNYLAAGIAVTLAGGTAGAIALSANDPPEQVGSLSTDELEHTMGKIDFGSPVEPQHWTKTGIDECDAYGDSLYSYFWCDSVTADTGATMLDGFRQSEEAWKLVPPDQRSKIAESCTSAREELESRAHAAGCELHRFFR